MDAWNLITLYGLYYVLRDVNRSDLGWNRGGFVPRSAFMDLDLDLKRSDTELMCCIRILFDLKEKWIPGFQNNMYVMKAPWEENAWHPFLIC